MRGDAGVRLVEGRKRACVGHGLAGCVDGWVRGIMWVGGVLRRGDGCGETVKGGEEEWQSYMSELLGVCGFMWDA